MILFLFTAILFPVLLELNKNSVIGWILTLGVLAAFFLLRRHVLSEQPWYLRFGGWVGLLVVLVLILYLTPGPYRPHPAVDTKNPSVTDIVTVEQGKLTGVYTEDGAVEVYTGIPYAKPPVGELRWKEPQDPEPWDGILAADHFAPMSMQPQNPQIVSALTQIIGYHDYVVTLDDNYRELVSEDSLYLNIWKPAGEVKDLPVLVYIHGGSLQTGQPWYADYSGEGLAREGVIVVNMGYRLGVFGFFADEALKAESPNGTTGNYGLLDQIKALEWVQTNIAAFGGDPGNVTLAGESAGSACVSALCTSPLAKGLFRRAIGESSTVTAIEPAHSYRSLEEAYETGAQLKEHFGVSGIDELRQLSAEELVYGTGANHHITVDGYALTEPPYESYQKGIHNEEALLHGYNKSEGSIFILFDNADQKNYEEKIRNYFGAYADEVLNLYPAKTDAEAKQNWIDIYSGVVFTYGHYCWTRQAMENSIPVYEYYFTKENRRLGAIHSGEEVYFYGNIPSGSKLYDETDLELSDTMKRYFVNFITTGDPNGAGLPEWDAVSDTDRIFELGDAVGVTEERYRKLYDILDEMQGWDK